MTIPDRSAFDAIVVGAGHNGLVTAAYLARGGMRTLLLEARSAVGGTAASEPFAGATVNICNCDHLTFRTTPVIEELGRQELGLEYNDVGNMITLTKFLKAEPSNLESSTVSSESL